MDPAATDDVLVIALDRWGRALVAVAREVDGPGRLPGGAVAALESPDEAAIRCFEEATGCLLEQLQLFRAYRPSEREADRGRGERLHVYFDDPDLDLAAITEDAAAEWAYLAPVDLGGQRLLSEHRNVLDEFMVSNAYRALFH